MVSDSLAAAPFDWDELFIYLEDRRIVPIVGRELLRLPVDGREVLLETYLAEQAAEDLGVAVDDLPEGFGLNDVALHLDRRGNRKKIYSRVLVLLRQMMKRDPLPIPEPLKQLAAITHFRLFVSATFDPLLKAAIDEVRFGGEDRTRSLAYSLHSEVADLPVDPERLSDAEPYVYKIFGEPTSVVSDYAVTDEDVLEFLHHLQSDHRPARLFDAFRAHHLIFLGCGFPDWLGRFFIRTLANERLRETRPTAEIIAELESPANLNLRAFLRDCEAWVFPAGDAVAFVAELHRRWREQYGDAEDTREELHAAARMEPGAVFLSYASQDRQAAATLKTALEAAGVEVWFDKKDLQQGDVWRSQLKSNILQCGVFLPLLSQNARGRREGVYREEWRWAVERSRGIAESVRFLQPVIVDDLAEGADDVPEEFWQRHCVRLPGGEPTGDFCFQLKEAIREFRLARRA